MAHARKITWENNVCIVGGCALNCAAIGKLEMESKPNSIYVPYSPGDDGAAIGCALFACGNNKSTVNRSPYLGTMYSDSEVLSAINEKSLDYDFIDDELQLYDIISREIADGKIIGWFQGRMEFGPRALGNRSILADPRNPKMKDLVNAKIKFRVNIVNNKNESYSNYVNFRIPLFDIDKGTSIKTKTTVGSEYNFFTI